MSRCDDWAEGWEEGRQQGEADMLAKCITAVEALRPLLFVDKYDGGYDCCGCSTLDQLHDDAIVALRALSANADSDGNVMEAYADERLAVTKNANMSEDITSALRVAANRLRALQQPTGPIHDLTDDEVDAFYEALRALEGKP